MSIIDFVAKLIDPKNDYTKVAIFFVVYLFSLWVLFCFWIFMDSQKRFKNFIISTIFFFAVLVFNLPALIFYLIIRPEKEDENVLFLHNESNSLEGGVNVPLVNFVGKDGEVKMTINLSMNKVMQHEANGNMNIKVDWNDSKDNNIFKIAENKVEQREESRVEVVEKLKNEFKTPESIKNLAYGLKDRFKKIASGIKRSAESKTDEETKTEKTKEVNKFSSETKKDLKEEKKVETKKEEIKKEETVEL